MRFAFSANLYEFLFTLPPLNTTCFLECADVVYSSRFGVSIWSTRCIRFKWERSTTIPAWKNQFENKKLSMRDAKDDIPLLHNFHYDQCNFWWSMQPPSTMHTLPTTKKKQTFSRSEKWKRGTISCRLFRWKNGASVKYLLPAGLNDVLEMSEWTFVDLLAW